MTELIIKMIFWLIAAMSLGFVIAWFLSKTIYTKKYIAEKDSLQSVVKERNNFMVKLEKNLNLEKSISKELLKNLKVTQEKLMEKRKLLENIEMKLERDNSNKSNNLLLIQIEKLKDQDLKRENELKDFGKVLLLAEDKIAENEKNHKSMLKTLDKEISALKLGRKIDKKSINSYKNQIDELKEDLILYKADISRAEFIMTKDQFIKIEEQLTLYQDEITSSKKENNKLIKRLETNFNGLERKVLPLEEEYDDGSIVKTFRETYKKITSA